METYSALLALCAGNSPVTGEFPSQRPVTQSFDVFFDLRLNKRSTKQSRGCWLRRRRANYDVIVMVRSRQETVQGKDCNLSHMFAAPFVVTFRISLLFWVSLATHIFKANPYTSAESQTFCLICRTVFIACHTTSETWKDQSRGGGHGGPLWPTVKVTLRRNDHYNDVRMSAMASQITGVSIDCSTLGRSEKPSNLRVTGLCAGDLPVTTGEYPAQMASDAENVSWRHHVS